MGRAKAIFRKLQDGSTEDAPMTPRGYLQSMDTKHVRLTPKITAAAPSQSDAMHGRWSGRSRELPEAGAQAPDCDGGANFIEGVMA